MSERYVIRIVAAADGGYASQAGCYVASFDADAHHGRGEITVTREAPCALIFHDPAAAFEFWKTQSSEKPLRLDGKPNRPLTAYTVEFVKVSS
jgi:hypothetical protein